MRGRVFSCSSAPEHGPRVQSRVVVVVCERLVDGAGAMVLVCAVRKFGRSAREVTRPAQPKKSVCRKPPILTILPPILTISARLRWRCSCVPSASLVRNCSAREATRLALRRCVKIRRRYRLIVLPAFTFESGVWPKAC